MKSRPQKGSAAVSWWVEVCVHPIWGAIQVVLLGWLVVSLIRLMLRREFWRCPPLPPIRLTKN